MRQLAIYEGSESINYNLEVVLGPYYLLVAFSFCSMVAGNWLGIEQGRSPSFAKRMERLVPISEIPNPAVAELKKKIEAEFGPSAQLTNFRLQTTAKSVEVHFGAGEIFPAGQAQFHSRAEEELRDLGRVLVHLAPDAEVEVEAYTDDSLISSSGSIYPTNWELSGARAARILRELQALGFSGERTRFAGRGDSHPLVPNRSPSGEPILENRLKNRRVLIRLTPPDPTKVEAR
jgi:flagellar motor protein MotB